MKRMLPLLLILAGCDPATPPQPETEPETPQVFETQVRALEKARAAGDQLGDAAAAQRAQLDGTEAQ
jgi:hypothetical protein